MTKLSPSPRSGIGVTQALHLADGLFRAGRLDEAEGLCRLSLVAQPQNAEAHQRLGDIDRRRGRFDAALENYRAALALEPDVADLHHNIAGLLLILGRADEARDSCLRALEIAPDHAEAHFNLGCILQGQNDVDAAIGGYRRALALRPDFAEAQHNLANALQKLGRCEEALAAYERAVALRPNDAGARQNFGEALHGQGRLDAAIGQYEAALALDAPGNSSRAALHQDYATALIALGRVPEAESAFLRAAALAPDEVGLHLDLASCRPFTASDARLAALEKFAAKAATLGEGDQIALNFALGKAYADLKRPELSFARLIEGNRLKRRQVAYDEAAMLGLFERIRQNFTPNLFEEKRGGGDLSRAPVFVVGMPRSGTTLIEQILASHSQIFGAGELDAFERSLGGADSFPESAKGLSKQQLRRVGARYRALSGASGAERVVDKMPANFAYVGLIHLALPNAKIIHARRSPVDTCLSCFSLLFSENQPHTYDLGELGRYYRAYEATMDHWRRVLPPGVMIDVDYEKVVGDLEGQARRMTSHCGLDWEAGCLAFHETRRAVHTASVTQVRQKLYAQSVDRWRLYGPLLQPLFEALEFSPDEKL